MSEVERAAALVAFADVFPTERYPYPEAQARARWWETLRGPATVLIAERDGSPVGFVSVSAGRLEALFVLPEESWGRGGADELYERALRHLRELGGRAQLWVRQSNYRARRFYERRGWHVDGRRASVPHPPYPELIGHCVTFDCE